MKLLHSNSEMETQSAGAAFSLQLQAGDIVLLNGDLGAGKTQFVKGIVQGLYGNPESVSSPTFALIQEYQAKIPVYHFDLYRLKSEQETLDIGIEEYLYGSGVCVIEWPEKAEGLWPERAYQVRLEHLSENKRLITIQEHAL